MTLKILRLLLYAVASAVSLPVMSQTSDARLSVRPIGRIHMDGALYMPSGNGFVDGAAISDVRIGAKASYGMFKAKIDIGFAYGKVSPKDVFIQADFDGSSRMWFGYFVHQFGLQSTTSSSAKISLEEPVSNTFFADPRMAGAMYFYDHAHIFATASLSIENQALKSTSDQLGKTGWGAMSRLVWRPYINPGQLLQIGLSGGYLSPVYNETPELNHKSYTFHADFPTRVASVTALRAVVPEARSLFKFTPELVAGYGRVAIESQYYYMQANRTGGLAPYKASGGYAMLRGMLIGSDYRHDHAECGIAYPAPKSLELVIGCDYVDASDHRCEIKGGIVNDVSCTVNYYINSYVTALLRYSYTSAHDRADEPRRHANILQARLQMVF